MLRFILAMMLIGGGGVLMGQLISQFSAAPRQTGPAAALSAIGILANLVTILRRRILLRPWVRNLTVLIGAILVAGLLFMRYRIANVVLPDVPIHDRALRQTLEHWEDALVWLALAAGYATLSLALLPTTSRRATNENQKPESGAGPPAVGG